MNSGAPQETPDVALAESGEDVIYCHIELRYLEKVI